MAGVRRPIKAAADLLGHSSTASRVICTAIPPTTPRGRRLTGSGRRSGCEAHEPTVLAPNSDSVLVDNRDECFHSVERALGYDEWESVAKIYRAGEISESNFVGAVNEAHCAWEPFARSKRSAVRQRWR